jgi:hypothetical protein
MGIKEDENELFAQWCQDKPPEVKEHFIRDGVVNENEFGMSLDENHNSDLRIVFFLKEVNGGENWDEREYLREYNNKDEFKKTHSQTITVLTQLAYGVLNRANTSTRWNEIELVVTDGSSIQTQVLQRIALVNVKKIAGSGNAEYDKINKFIKNDKNRNNLKQQLDIYSKNAIGQTVIVCGGTDWYYKQLYNGLTWKQTSRGIEYCKQDKKIIIAFCHPLARIAPNIKYFALVDALNEILDR